MQFSFEKAEAYIFTALFAHKRVTFKDHWILFCRKIFTFVRKILRYPRNLFKNVEQDI